MVHEVRKLNYTYIWIKGFICYLFNPKMFIPSHHKSSFQVHGGQISISVFYGTFAVQIALQIALSSVVIRCSTSKMNDNSGD